MNRPEALNAITVEMIESFSAALAAADGDGDVRVLVLTGPDARSAWVRTSRN
jgi:enoyl-CoA hydratase/carnithine racemase